MPKVQTHQHILGKEWDIQMVSGLMNHQLIPNSEGAKFVRCDELHSQTRVTGGSSIDFAVRPQSLVWLLCVFFCSDRWVSKKPTGGGRGSYLQFPGSHWGVCTALSWKLYGEYMLVFCLHPSVFCRRNGCGCKSHKGLDKIITCPNDTSSRQMIFSSTHLH